MDKLPQLSGVVNKGQQMLQSVQNSELGSKGQEVMSTISEDAPVLREAFGQITTEPQNAFAKIVAVFKDIWAKIVEVGFLSAFVAQIKALFSGAANDDTSVDDSKTGDEKAAASSATVSKEQPLDPKAPVNAGQAAPLLQDDKP